MVFLWHVRTFIGLGAIFAALSELWFYPISDVAGLVELTIFYAIAAHAAVLMVAAVGGSGAMGFYLAAVILGFLVEAIPVFELFTALPFTLIWTSVAWHGLVSGLIGVWLYRAAAAQGVWAFLAMNACFGAALGVWGAYFWSAEPEGMRYAEQLPWAFFLFACGHLVLPQGTPPSRFLKPVMWVMLALVAFGFVAGTVLAVGLLAVILPLVCAVTLFAVRGASGDQPLWSSLPLRRIWVIAMMPTSAVLVFDWASGAPWIAEINAYAILVLGPVSVWLLVVSIWRATKKGHPVDAL